MVGLVSHPPKRCVEVDATRNQCHHVSGGSGESREWGLAWWSKLFLKRYSVDTNSRHFKVISKRGLVKLLNWKNFHSPSLHQGTRSSLHSSSHHLLLILLVTVPAPLRFCSMDPCILKTKGPWWQRLLPRVCTFRLRLAPKDGFVPGSQLGWGCCDGGRAVR